MTRPLETLNLKDKLFHSSIDWLGLYLQVYIPSWVGEVFRFTVFRLLENAFVKLFPSLGMIWSLLLPSRTTHPLYKLVEKSLTPRTLGGGTMIASVSQTVLTFRKLVMLPFFLFTILSFKPCYSKNNCSLLLLNMKTKRWTRNVICPKCSSSNKISLVSTC